MIDRICCLVLNALLGGSPTLLFLTEVRTGPELAKYMRDKTALRVIRPGTFSLGVALFSLMWLSCRHMHGRRGW